MIGRIHVLRGRHGEARSVLSRALSIPLQRPALTARIGFELGCIYLSTGDVLTAETTLTYTQSLLGAASPAMADLLHLRALIAEARGKPVRALALYRAAVRNSAHSLSPLTLVLALRNLAAGLAHTEPGESVRLTDLAADVLESRGLDEAVRTSLLNVRGYALACMGDLDGALRCATQAAALASDHGNIRAALQARFNLAVARELLGDVDGAREELTRIGDESLATGNDDLRRWVDLRLVWLDYLRRDAREAEKRLASVIETNVPVSFQRTVDTLRSIIGYSRSHDGRWEQDLHALIATYEREADAATAVVLILWRSWILRQTGRTSAARTALARAYDIGRKRSFRLSPNWWHPAIVESATEIAATRSAEYFRSLHRGPSVTVALADRPHPPVRLGGAGPRIGDQPMSDERWREGRAGAHVLRRYFQILSDARGMRVPRDAIIDTLWPESDGDRAVRNLYAATSDLRRVIASIPGLRLVVEDRCYQLRADENVRFE